MKVKTIAPNREEWLRARLEGIGASDAAAAVGLSPYVTPLQLWAEKTGRTPPAEENDAMRWGHRLQRVVGEAFEEETHRIVEAAGEFTIYAHDDPDSGFLLATLDFFQRKGFGQPLGILEAKTAGYMKKDDWADAPPIHYVCQVQHQMMVTGLPFASIAALIGGQKFVWQDITPDVEFQNRLRYALEKFWHDYVKRDVPPPAMADDNSILGQVIKERKDQLIVAPGAAIDLDMARCAAIEDIKRAERRRDEAEAQLKMMIGESAGIALPNGVVYKWRTEHRNAYTVPASERRTLRRSQ